MPFQITAADVEIAQDSVKIKNQGLVNSLIRMQQLMLEELGDWVKLPPVRLMDVSIDAQGKVVISNPEYAEAWRQDVAAPGGAAIKNGNCNCAVML